MPASAIEGYEFGPYRMDSGERLLHRGDALIPLPPKVAGTLLVLVQNAGRMVEKGDLIKAVWPDTFVEEGALTRNISLLRKTLEDTGEEAAYIETIPRRGYRFVAPVRTVAIGADPAVAPATADGGLADGGLANRTGLVDGGGKADRAGSADRGGPAELTGSAEQAGKAEPAESQPSSRKSAAKWIGLAAILLVAGGAAVARYVTRHGDAPRVAPLSAPENTLAVMPFRSLDIDASQDYFAEGMTQALITGLARLGKLRVVSLISDVGGQGDAAARDAILKNQAVNRVLTGTIVRSGGRVRIDAKLTDPRTGFVHWANSYERDLGDVLALEDAVSEAIASEIQVSLTATDREHLRQRHSINPEALDAYLRGRYFWNRRTEDGLRRAAQYFQKAIAADPTYAPAYSGLADSYSLLGSIGTDGMAPNQAMPLAKAAAQKALELDPDLAEGHVSLANVKLSYDWDLPGAAREFSRALALNPNSATGRHWLSHYYMAAGDLGKAAREMHAALELEPLSPSINIGVGWCLYYSRQYDQAIVQYRSIVEMDPSFPMAHQTLGMAYQQKGLLEQAIEEYRRAAAFSGNSPGSVAALASAYAAAGSLVEARQELARLEEMARTRYVPAFYFASVHYAMGDLKKTFEWGWKAVDEHCDYLIYLNVEPRVGKLAVHPEFLRAMSVLHRR
ncbi:MAG: winged helix-turn-helix domain-containing protein [Acidobacteriia bacterium]|nr:winged helix-turn-helix domain-containing protein [Terriglobia bacterium]